MFLILGFLFVFIKTVNSERSCERSGMHIPDETVGMHSGQKMWAHEQKKPGGNWCRVGKRWRVRKGQCWASLEQIEMEKMSL